MERNYVICFTGHRPQGLPWGYNESLDSCAYFKSVMTSILSKAIDNGYTHFISGMALGVDVICAEIVLELKKSHPEITLECAIPCKGQEKRWQRLQQVRYLNILKKADKVYYVSKDNYKNGCMQERNIYMVKQADVVIAVWNGHPSGTYNTIKAAKILGKQIRIVNPFNSK